MKRNETQMEDATATENVVGLARGSGDPRDTIFGSRANKPEILYPSTVPLCFATWFRNGQGEWVTLDPEICAATRRANPRQLHVTTARPQR